MNWSSHWATSLALHVIPERVEGTQLNSKLCLGFCTIRTKSEFYLLCSLYWLAPKVTSCVTSTVKLCEASSHIVIDTAVCYHSRTAIVSQSSDWKWHIDISWVESFADIYHHQTSCDTCHWVGDWIVRAWLPRLLHHIGSSCWRGATLAAYSSRSQLFVDCTPCQDLWQ